MYQDLYFWRRIRRRILDDGESIHHVSKTTQISRFTIRKMLKHEKPIPYKRGTNAPIQDLKKKAKKIATEDLQKMIGSDDDEEEKDFSQNRED